MHAIKLKSEKNIQHSESLLFLLIWLAIFLIPVLIHRNKSEESSGLILETWIVMTAYLLIFIINIYALIPAFLARKQYVKYSLWVLLTASFLICADMKIMQSYQLKSTTDMPPMVISSGRVPMEFSESMPPPPGYQAEADPSASEKNLTFLELLVIGVLVAGTGAAYKIIFLWVMEEKKLKNLEASLQKSSEEEFLFVKSDYKTVRIKFSDILYIESANEYIKIFTQNGEVITTFMRLKNIETTLPADLFMRVQRSYIVNLEKIKAVEKNRIFIEHKKHIPIGEQYKEAFQEFLGKNFVK
jgi:hypothetical protein